MNFDETCFAGTGGARVSRIQYSGRIDPADLLEAAQTHIYPRVVQGVPGDARSAGDILCELSFAILLSFKDPEKMEILRDWHYRFHFTVSDKGSKFRIGNNLTDTRSGETGKLVHRLRRRRKWARAIDGDEFFITLYPPLPASMSSHQIIAMKRVEEIIRS